MRTSRLSINASLFFFSSRRRHTRYVGDWSSDVCSSDLISTVDRLRATVEMLRSAYAGETATTPEGEPFRLALVPERPPPIWIAALGPKATRLAGAIADGVLLNWCTPERVARAREELAGGAAEGGRDPAEVTVGVYVRACVHVDADAAWLAVSAAAAQYASYPA